VLLYIIDGIEPESPIFPAPDIADIVSPSLISLLKPVGINVMLEVVVGLEGGSPWIS
jgi:hypothetical protein